jgi:competence protein ComEA
MIKHLLSALFAVLLTLGAATAFAAVDANKATQAELESVKGIGPAVSGKILDERKKGNFKDWTDLVERVKGVGGGNAAKFSTEGLTVNGQGFKGAAAPAAKADAKPAKAEKSAEKPADKAAVKTDTASAPMSKADSKAAAKAKKDEEAAAKAKLAADEKAAMAKAKDDAKAAKAAKADPAASAAKK